MKFTGLLTATVLAAGMASQMVMADDNSPNFSEAQKSDIQKIVHDYLINNPDVLVEVSQALQQKQQQNVQKQAQSAILENAGPLFSDKITTVGNPQGGVTLVEFFDYQCIHCKKMAPVLSELIKNDSNLRVIYKEFPIFGESSEKASRAALAAGLQNKYLAMHDALINQEKHLDDKIINNAAKSIGLNMTKFKADLTNKQVTEALEETRKLAEKLHLMGTPAFIVAATPEGKLKEGSAPDFIPGAASREALQDMIKKASGT